MFVAPVKSSCIFGLELLGGRAAMSLKSSGVLPCSWDLQMTVNQSLISHCLLSKTPREEMLGACISVSSCSVPRVLRLYSPCILPFRTVVRQTCSAVLSSPDTIRQPNFFFLWWNWSIVWLLHTWWQIRKFRIRSWGQLSFPWVFHGENQVSEEEVYKDSGVILSH